MKATVLWFDIRDGFGIATDQEGNEYYLSNDCCPKDLKAKEEIEGELKDWSNCLGLINVKRIY